MNGSWEIAVGGLGLALLAMAGVWVCSVVQRDVSLVDRYWGLGFALLAWWYFLAESAGPRSGWAVAVPVMVTIWGGRLSLHLTWRNWGRGEDYRYRAMRERTGRRFQWTSLVTVFGLQAVLMWLISLVLLPPARSSAAPALGVAGLGVVVWLVGFGWEAIGDWQLARFRADPGNRGRVLDSGLWRYSRHPNYFGDALLWWGYFLLAAAYGAWWTIVSPLIMTVLLLKVSGVALLERSLVDTKPEYRDYVARTSAFVPWLPK